MAEVKTAAKRRHHELRDNEWKTEKTLVPGTHEIWARATDALGRSQPLDAKIYWNPNGYEWTGIFKNEVTVE